MPLLSKNLMSSSAASGADDRLGQINTLLILD
jgi:hypothetical protein